MILCGYRFSRAECTDKHLSFPHNYIIEQQCDPRSSLRIIFFHTLKSHGKRENTDERKRKNFKTTGE